MNVASVVEDRRCDREGVKANLAVTDRNPGLPYFGQRSPQHNGVADGAFGISFHRRDTDLFLDVARGVCQQCQAEAGRRHGEPAAYPCADPNGFFASNSFDEDQLTPLAYTQLDILVSDLGEVFHDREGDFT